MKNYCNKRTTCWHCVTLYFAFSSNCEKLHLKSVLHETTIPTDCHSAFHPSTFKQSQLFPWCMSLGLYVTRCSICTWLLLVPDWWPQSPVLKLRSRSEFSVMYVVHVTKFSILFVNGRIFIMPVKKDTWSYVNIRSNMLYCIMTAYKISGLNRSFWGNWQTTSWTRWETVGGCTGANW